MNTLAALAILAEDPNYRVLRKLQPMPAGTEFRPHGDPEDTGVGVIVDTETTGWSNEQHKIINLGMVLFEFSISTGKIFSVSDTYNGYEDPGHPLEQITTEVTGITDEMVKGKRFSDELVNQIIHQSDVVICHNCSFDRPFLEKRFPQFKAKDFSCSASDIRWDVEEIISSRALVFLAAYFGYFYEAHRAINDCYATLELIRQTTPKSKRLVWDILLDRAAASTAQIWAWQSPFESKDLLRQEGYRWIAEAKCWVKSIPHATNDQVAAEMEWLKNNIYGRHNLAKIRYVPAKDRFSEREFQLG